MAQGRESAVFVWTDRALFVGDRSETSVHSHHALELCVALDDRGIDMRGPEGPDHAGVPGAVVRAGASHQLAVPGPKVAVLYLDPQSEVAASIERWLGDRALRPLPSAPLRDVRAGFGALLRDAATGLEDAQSVCAMLIGELAAEAPRPSVHWRVRHAMERIDSELGEPPSLDALAREVGVSPSRLRHVFKEQTGLPMRRYVLWMRLRAALLRALEGASMAESAQDAGFADAAHFTRTCRQMFGLPPTAFTPVDRVFVAP